MIDVRDVVVEYGKKAAAVRAVDGLSLRVAPGESLALIGPSGCGKSSLLFAMAGLIRPMAWTILVNGEPLTRPRREIALILQNAGLLPWKTVWQNANLSLLLGREYPRVTAQAVLDELGLGEVKCRYPSELSEGMKRRVGVARALSTSPSVMLMDEPLASLDTLTKERIQDLFLRLWVRHAFALVLVTHDIEEAAFLGQRVAVLSDRPAQIKEVVENPAMGERNYRDTAAFADTVQRLRAGLER
ncbi:MAG: ATP-binding cassette domain-containing protein [Candidatus Bipolaricaulota bacterium]|nr:ATP-binding cassette domain-containing protein [Candidatus Bipolaricaulota bacterium]